VTADHLAANLESWRAVEAFVERMGDRWRAVAQRFLGEGVRFRLDSYFRAGQSMDELVFSTLDHHGLQWEPRVMVKFFAEDRIHVKYVHPPARGPEYTLPFDQAFPTFVRFLSQIWSATMPEAVPEEVRAALRMLQVPVLL
jgi:hypothetical protein